MTYLENATGAKSAFREPSVVGFDPALYERWKPEASRVENQQESIPLFVRRSPTELPKAEASLFLDRLVRAHLELVRILTEKDAECHDADTNEERLHNEKC